MDNPSAGI
jgi:hypothetical protein